MRHVLFWDIDGTLLTTGRAGIFALEQAARDVCGAEVDLEGMRTAGLTDGEIARAIILECDGTAAERDVERFLAAYERHLPDRLHWRRGRVLAGVEAVLDRLERRDDVVNLLLTGNTPAGARAKLSHYGLDSRFAGGAFCIGGESRASVAQRALEESARRGTDPELARLFVIGDTPQDVACGRLIGATTVAVASGVHSPAELREAGAAILFDEMPTPAEFEEALGLPPIGSG